MKIALYIEDGLEQIVLTPQSDTEKYLLKKLSNGGRQVTITSGGFYACQGGWMRHESEAGNDSTILVLRPPEPKP